jgi:hypothetical protein
MKPVIRLTKLMTICLFVGSEFTSKTKALAQRDFSLDD